MLPNYPMKRLAKAYKSSPGVRARNAATKRGRPNLPVLAKKPSMRSKAFNMLSKTVDLDKAKSGLQDFMSQEFDRNVDKFSAKVADVLPFATATAAKIMMSHVHQTVSQSMFGSGRSGSRSTALGVTAGSIAGKEVKNYAMRFEFHAPRAKELAHLIKQNPSSKLQLAPVSDSPADSSRAFFQSGYNAKGVMRWANIPNSNSTKWNPADLGISANTYPLSWNVSDDELMVLKDPGLVDWDLATTLFAGSNQSINYPVVSRHIDFQVFNSNAYMPCTAKIYLCKRKSGATYYTTPMADWFADPVDGQRQGLMDTRWTNKWDTEPASNIFDQPIAGDWIKESSINLNAFPGMSSNFGQRWEICEVRKQRLAPLESLNVSVEIQASNFHSLRNTIQQKTNRLDAITSPDWPYAFMIEFQGQNGLVVPRVNNGSGQAVDGQPQLVDAMATKVRFKYRKYAKVAFASMTMPQAKTNMYMKEFTTSDGATVSVPLGGMAGILDTNMSASLPVRDFNNYGALSDETGGVGTYYIPIYTEQQKQVAKPLANQQ